jgi:hypothetical protein
MIHDHASRRFSQPLEERKVAERVGAEDLEHLDVFVADVFLFLGESLATSLIFLLFLSFPFPSFGPSPHPFSSST